MEHGTTNRLTACNYGAFFLSRSFLTFKTYPADSLGIWSPARVYFFCTITAFFESILILWGLTICYTRVTSDIKNQIMGASTAMQYFIQNLGNTAIHTMPSKLQTMYLLGGVVILLPVFESWYFVPKMLLLAIGIWSPLDVKHYG